ncbi:VOC family protein [Candidatus Enterococcus clewellii]|uniref:VOC domain-containing protein n=1 Tax=Candidatus Enterococcus clewellii TaxID=1834193 RepID=A0A242K4T9_9ENTE|nr:VOC family protein [Enterococcus sp. 9E7_DIV0242]OTP14453.1 hypothetical protein A5888_002554 [Enterococcus sp. 9E7_DIV0242]
MSFVHHICIQTNDYEQSVAFYQQIGFTLVEETPDFHGRSYNSWLQLQDFYIELQTGKGTLKQHDNKEYTGIAHFCLWMPDLKQFIQDSQFSEDVFIRKDGVIIYQVLGGSLCKARAPEGTIVEFREKQGV